MIAVASAKPLYAFGLAIPFWRVAGSTGFLEESLEFPMVIVVVRNSVTDNRGNRAGDLVACHQPRNTPFAPLIRYLQTACWHSPAKSNATCTAPLQDRFGPYAMLGEPAWIRDAAQRPCLKNAC